MGWFSDSDPDIALLVRSRIPEDEDRLIAQTIEMSTIGLKDLAEGRLALRVNEGVGLALVGL